VVVSMVGGRRATTPVIQTRKKYILL